MRKIEHVRFRLGALIQELIKQRQCPPGATIAEALSAYYAWAESRGWRLLSAHGQVDRNQTLLTVEDGQVTIRSEEYWDTVWAHSDPDKDTQSPDFLELYGKDRAEQGPPHDAESEAEVVIRRLEASGWNAEGEGVWVFHGRVTLGLDRDQIEKLVAAAGVERALALVGQCVSAAG